MSGGGGVELSIISCLSFIFIKSSEEYGKECYEPKSGFFIRLIHTSVRGKVQIWAVSMMFSEHHALICLGGKRKGFLF